MKVRTVTYAMLRKERDFENDRAEITVDLEPGDEIADAIALAKATCREALAMPISARPPGGDKSRNAREYRDDPKNERPIEPYAAPWGPYPR